MPFEKGQSGNPSGRPPGVGQVNELRCLLMSRSEEVVTALIDKAVQGDVSAMKLIIDRLIPVLRSIDTPVSLPRADSGDLTDQSQIIVSHLLNGGLPADIGARLMQSLVLHQTMTELKNLESRIMALEEKGNDHD